MPDASYQDLVRINLAIRDGSIFREKPWWKHSLSRRRTTKPVHFLGLVSDGGVHSHLDHLKALCDAAKRRVQDVYIHAFTDGRDTDPKGGLVICASCRNT